MDKYETIDFLGEGSFAKVSKAKDAKTGEVVAIKKLKKKYPTWQECVDLREVKSLNKLKQNDNIIKLKEMIRIEDTLYLVFEYMEKNLYQLITERQNKKFSEAQIRYILWQTLQGVAYMHKYGFFHRDLKPENLLVNGEKIKLADFGLAREIRSIPPYTDYVSTRYYRAPECILKSTNYNSPVDIWAVGCIMAELYNFKPLFYGSSEKEVLFRIAAVLGSPNTTSWPEGIQLAKKIDVKFPATFSNSLTINQMIPDANKEAIDLMSEMLRWDPNKRATAINLLQHPFFTNYPIPIRINTPEMADPQNFVGLENTAKKTFTNLNQNKQISLNTHTENKNNIIGSISNEEISYITKKEDDEISKLLEDTVGFNRFIHKLKNEKIEEDLKFEIEQTKTNYFKDQISPIANKLEDEFDFEIEKLFSHNKDKLLDTNSLLNMNISNLTNTYMNGNLTGRIFDSFKNKNFFDNSVINKINNYNENKDNQGYFSNVGENEKNQVDNSANGEQGNIIINYRRKTNVNITNFKNNGEKEQIDGDNTEKIIQHSNSEKINEVDFDNCNVYLKNINPDNNRTYSRKRSAFKYIEDNLEKEKLNKNNFNSTSNLIKNLNLNDNSSNNINGNFINKNQKINNNMANNGNLNGNLNNKNNIGNLQKLKEKDLDNKPRINQENSGKISQNFPLNEKKPEYESRRKKHMNFINGIDNFSTNQMNNNNLHTFENQQKQDKLKLIKDEGNGINGNLISGSGFESRRIQANFSKPIIAKEKEGESVNKNKNFLKI